MMQLDNTDHSFYLLGGEIRHQGSSELNQLARLTKKCIHCHLGIEHGFMLFVKVKASLFKFNIIFSFCESEGTFTSTWKLCFSNFHDIYNCGFSPFVSHRNKNGSV